MIRRRSLLGLVGAALAAGALAGCDVGAYESLDGVPDDPAPATTKGHFGLGFLGGRSPLSEGEAPRIVAELRRAIGGGRIQCQTARVDFDSLDLYVSKANGDVDWWRWREGSISGPEPERDSVSREQLFDLSDVPWDKLAHLRILAKQRVSLEQGQSREIFIRRLDGRLAIEVELKGLRRSATLTFDATGALVK